MHRVFFITIATAFIASSCQRFEALNNPDILTALSQDYSYPITNSARDSYNEIQLQENFKLPANCDTLSLADLFGIAIQNNPNIGKTWQEARSAASRYSASMSKFLPSAEIIYSADAILADTPFKNVIGTEKYWSWGPKISLDFLVFDFGQRGYASDSYYQLLQSSNLSHKQMLQKTLQSIATRYYNYLYSKEKLVADIADLANYEEDLKAAEKKAKLGIASKSDTLLAKSKYLNAKIIVVNQETFAENAFIDLVKSVGISPSATFKIKGFDEKIEISKERPDKKDLVEIAKHQRPDYLQNKALVLSQEANYKSIRARHLPSACISGQASSDNYSTGLRNAAAYDITFALSFPLFSGFLITNETREAQSDLKSAVDALRINEIQLVQEVYTAFNNICNYEKQLVLTQEYLEASRQEYAIILEKYKKGLATILDLLQASSSLSDARAQMIQAKKGYFNSSINLSYATGTLTNAKN